MKKTTLSAKNKKFWALTKPQQRVAVAKDVIKMLNTKFLHAKKGTYFQFDSSVKIVPEKLDDLFSTIKRKQDSCTVCGIGGCFAGMVDLGNKITTKSVIGEVDRVEYFDEIGDEDMRKYLRKVFTPRQLTMIECAFEMYAGHHDGKDYAKSWGTKAWDKNVKDSHAADDFGRNYANSNDRLIAIMENIIKNKGEFKP